MLNSCGLFDLHRSFFYGPQRTYITLWAVRRKPYAHFFHNPTWGISIDRVNPETVGAIPFTRLSTEQVRRLAKAYDELANKEQAYLTKYAPPQGAPLNLQNEVDEKVDAVLKIPESLSMLARQSHAGALPVEQRKVRRFSNQATDANQLAAK